AANVSVGGGAAGEPRASPCSSRGLELLFSIHDPGRHPTGHREAFARGSDQAAPVVGAVRGRTGGSRAPDKSIEAGAACGARRRGFPQTHARTLDHGLRALRRALVSRVVTIDVADGRRGRESAISFAREYSPVSGTPSRRAGHAK